MSVSVCLPVYNGEGTIRKAIESVLAQTYSDLEILVFDDGSRDATAKIAGEYNVRLLQSANEGVAKARNRMLAEAKFDLVAMIDHDDTWHPTKLEKQMPAFNDPAVVLSHTDCRFVYPDGSGHDRDLGPYTKDDPFSHLLPSNRLCTSSVVFRKQPLIRAGGFAVSTRCSDWYGWFELARVGNFIHTPEVLVDYLVRDDSLANAGYSFHEAQHMVLSEFIPGQAYRLFEKLDSATQAKYLALAKRSDGVALSSMSRCKIKMHDRQEARTLAIEAVKRAPQVMRVWTRALRAFLS